MIEGALVISKIGFAEATQIVNQFDLGPKNCKAPIFVGFPNMKIAVVTETFWPFKSGTAKRYFEVFRRIAKRGHCVTVFTTRFSSSWPVYDEVEGIHIFRSKKVYPHFISQNGFRSITDVLDFSYWSFRQLLRESFDVVETSHCPIFPAMTSWLYAKSRHIPLVVTFHEVWGNQWYIYAPRRIYAQFGIALEKMLGKLPDVAVAVSGLTAKRLALCLGYPVDRIFVISNGINPNICLHIPAKNEPNKIVYAGRLNPHKKIEWLLKAYPKIKKVIPDVNLSIVGDGPSEYVKKLKNDYGFDGVRFTGQLNDVEFLKEIKSAYIYVLPSIREGQSITLLEAMACGTPQVVVKGIESAASELVRLSKSGLVVPSSSEGIAQGVITLFQNRELWASLRENGLRYVMDFTWDHATEQYLKIYEYLTTQNLSD